MNKVSLFQSQKKHLCSFWGISLLSTGVFITPHIAAETYFETSGKVEIEATAFQEEGQFEGQDYQDNFSVAIEPEFYWGWNDDYDSITFTPYLRLDQQDEERTHADIRELVWTHVTDNWEFRTGISKIFWGVTEFNHLVDVINQTDAVNSFDGEDKLGQPIIAASKVTDMGIFDAYILPGFRTQTAVGEDGRFRSSTIVDVDSAIYESDDEEQHVDFALRWSHSVDVYDFGLYVFDGTDRSPVYTSTTANGDLQPYYQQMTQVGLDIQATIDSWLLKFEGIAKSIENEDYHATQTGFEYTFYGISGTLADLGLLVEYGWDERGEDAGVIAQNDTYIGGRLTLNNTSDTAILLGFSYDNDYYSKMLFLEASQRMSDYWTVALDAVVVMAENDNDLLSYFDQDDSITLTLERFF